MSSSSWPHFLTFEAFFTSLIPQKLTADEGALVTQFCADVQRAARIVDTPANFMHCG